MLEGDRSLWDSNKMEKMKLDRDLKCQQILN